MKFFYPCRKSLVILMIAGLFLTACSTTIPTHHPNGIPLTPAEIRLRERKESYNQAVAIGTTVGCIAGILFVVIASFDDDADDFDADIATFLCNVGGFIGGTAGAMLTATELKEAYAEGEKEYRTMIIDVKKTNANLTADIADARSIITNDRARIDQIDSELAAGQISKQEASVNMQTVDDNIEIIADIVENLKKKRDEYIKLAQKDDTEMAKEIATLESQITLMEKEVASLIIRREVSPL